MTMRARPRTVLAALLAAALLLAALAGCGGGDDEASTSTPVDQLLRDTFAGDKDVRSGKLAMSLRIDAEGSSQLQGPVTVRIDGPFESQGKGRLPKLGLDASVEGTGQDLAGGFTSTGDKGFLSFQGADYAIPDASFAELRRGFERSQAQAEDRQGGQSLAALGIDPRRWLVDARTAGEAQVGDTDTIRITAGVDVPRLLDDVERLLQRAGPLAGPDGQSLPRQLSEERKQALAEAIERLRVEIYTGKDDRILRRMVVDAGVRPPQGGASGARSATLHLDVALTDLNESQDIAAPTDARPLSELTQSLGGLGASGADGGAGGANLDRYSKCIEDAGNDAGKARKCADLLTP